MANLYANVVQLGRPDELRECFRMLTDRSARLLNLEDYGLEIGRPADVVVIDAQTPEQAIAEISQPVAAFKRGQQTVAASAGTAAAALTLESWCQTLRV